MKKLTAPAVYTAATTGFAASNDINYADIYSDAQAAKMNEKIRHRFGPITATGTYMISNALPAGYRVESLILDVKAIGGSGSGSTVSVGTTTASLTTVLNAYRWDTASIAAVGFIDISTSIITLNPTSSDRALSIYVVDGSTGTPNFYVNATVSKVVTI